MTSDLTVNDLNVNSFRFIFYYIKRIRLRYTIMSPVRKLAGTLHTDDKRQQRLEFFFLFTQGHTILDVFLKTSFRKEDEHFFPVRRNFLLNRSCPGFVTVCFFLQASLQYGTPFLFLIMPFCVFLAFKRGHFNSVLPDLHLMEIIRQVWLWFHYIKLFTLLNHKNLELKK